MITNFENLRNWFVQAQRTDEPVHWNLYSHIPGEAEKRVAFNVAVDDTNASFEMLMSNIRMMNNPDGKQFKVMLYPKNKANNPLAHSIVQIFEKTNGSSGTALPAPGIAGLPVGMGSIQEYVQKEVQLERMKWEIDELKSALAQPNTGWERAVETIGAIPGIEKAIQALVVGLVTKFNPAATPAIQAAMNGTPETSAGYVGETDTDDEPAGDPQTIFATNIQQAAATLKTDPLTLAQRINRLVQTNPEIAKQLLENG